MLVNSWMEICVTDVGKIQSEEARPDYNNLVHFMLEEQLLCTADSVLASIRDLTDVHGPI